MLKRIPKQNKERFTIYIPEKLARAIRQAALDSGKTISKYIADVVEADRMAK